MQKIGGFFEKFQGKIAGQIHNLIIVSEVVKKHTGIEIEMKNISISGQIMRLRATSVEKNEIFMKKDRILKEINARVKSLVLKDLC